MSCTFSTKVIIFAKTSQELEILQQTELPSFKRMKEKCISNPHYPYNSKDKYFLELAGEITSRQNNSVVIEANGNYGNYLSGLELSQLYPELIVFEHFYTEQGDHCIKLIKTGQVVELSRSNYFGEPDSNSTGYSSLVRQGFKITAYFSYETVNELFQRFETKILSDLNSGCLSHGIRCRLDEGDKNPLSD